MVENKGSSQSQLDALGNLIQAQREESERLYREWISAGAALNSLEREYSRLFRKAWDAVPSTDSNSVESKGADQ